MSKVQGAPEVTREDSTSRKHHYQHPTDPSKFWCGAPRTSGNPIGTVSASNKHAECVVCDDLWNVYGTLGWLEGRSPA